jgi:hypothetical protein
MRHVVMFREQILAAAKLLTEFEGIVALDFQYSDSGDPLRWEVIWEDEE